MISLHFGRYWETLGKMRADISAKHGLACKHAHMMPACPSTCTQHAHVHTLTNLRRPQLSTTAGSASRACGTARAALVAAVLGGGRATAVAHHLTAHRWRRTDARTSPATRRPVKTALLDKRSGMTFVRPPRVAQIWPDCRFWPIWVRLDRCRAKFGRNLARFG